MWYVYDLRDKQNKSTTWLSKYNKVVLRNCDTLDFVILDLNLGYYDYLDKNMELLNRYEFEPQKGLKFIHSHRKLISGVGKDCFKVVTDDDIKLLDYIERPQIYVRKCSNCRIASHIKGDKFRMIFNEGTLLNLLTSKSCDVVGKKYIYIPTDRIGNMVEFGYRYKIKSYKKYNAFITKYIMLRRESGVQDN